MSTILGPDGKPLDLNAVLRGIEEPQTAQLASIRREFDRHPARGLTPARLASLMQRGEEGDLVGQAELASDMEERDAHLFAELSKRRGAITALDWSIEPPDKPTPDEAALTELVRDWMDMVTAEANGLTGGLDVVINAMTAAVLPGYAPIELRWELRTDSRGRQVRVPHATLQPQRWFTLSGDRRRFLLRSEKNMTPAVDGFPAVMGEELRPLAWLMHVHPARHGGLARSNLARVLFWPYLFKNYAVRDFAEFLEIYGLPLRIGKYPTAAGDAEKTALLRAVTEIGHNAAGIIPQSMAMEIIEAARGTDAPFVAMWDKLDAAESKAILGQTLTASEGQNGTQALGKVHNEVRMDIREADAELVEEAISSQLISPLCQLNQPGVNPRRLPRLCLDTGETEDLGAYATALPALVNAGMRIPVTWVRDRLGIPEPQEGEEVLQASAPQAAQPAPGSLPANTPPANTPPPAPPAKPAATAKPPTPQALAGLIADALAAHAKATAGGPPRDLVDELVDEQAAQWQPLLGPMIKPLLAELEKSLAAGEGMEAFAARLPDLVSKMDAQPITEALARAAFSARLAGEADLDLEKP